MFVQQGSMSTFMNHPEKARVDAVLFISSLSSLLTILLILLT